MSEIVTTPEPPAIKVGQLVYNERQRRWGQAVWDEKKYRFETGMPLRVLVFDTTKRGTIDWPLDDLSCVVEKGKIVWEDPTLRVRLENSWREAEGRLLLGVEALEVANVLKG
jgi:hypothetical protein